MLFKSIVILALSAMAAASAIRHTPRRAHAPSRFVRVRRQAGGNLQTFTGALGGIAAPAVTTGGRGFVVAGSDDFLNLGAALGRSCDIQKNQAANAANSGAAFSVGDGDQQNAACRAAIQGATPAQPQGGAAQNAVQANVVQGQNMNDQQAQARMNGNNNDNNGMQQGNAMAQNQQQEQGNAQQNQNQNQNANDTANNGNGQAGNAAVGLQIGTCNDPTLAFENGVNGRRESVYLPNNQADFPQGEAQNPDIVTRAICDTFINRCGISVGDAEHDTCLQAAASIAGAVGAERTGALADEFNAFFGVTTNFAAVPVFDNQGKQIA